MEFRRTFTAAEIRDAIDDNPPSKRTIQDTLDAIETKGFLNSTGGAGRAPREFHPAEQDRNTERTGYTQGQNTHSSIFPFPGGKGSISAWIVDKIPEHDTYVEVFGGGAGVLYNKPRSKYEIYNHIDSDLTQFFSIVRNRPDELATWLQSVPYSRSQYNKWVTAFYDGYRPDDPIKRAGRFFSLRYMQYAGVSSTANGFKTRARRSPARTFENARNRIDTLAQRFAQVTIENQDYQSIFETYDDSTVDVVFYLDPPYVRTENHYSGEFNHREFVDSLQDIDSDWILSCKRVPPQLLDYQIRERESRHRMKRTSEGITEHLVSNFDPEKQPAFV